MLFSSNSYAFDRCGEFSLAFLSSSWCSRNTLTLLQGKQESKNCQIQHGTTDFAGFAIFSDYLKNCAM